VPVIEPVPAALTAPVQDPGLHGPLVRDTWAYILDLQCALAKANAKLAAIATGGATVAECGNNERK
jgi:hypothetical protein